MFCRFLQFSLFLILFCCFVESIQSLKDQEKISNFENRVTESKKSEIVEDELVVQFNEYLEEKELAKLLREIIISNLTDSQLPITPNNPYQIQPNRIKGIPSDFVVLKVTNESINFVKERLEANKAKIRRFFYQRKFFGGILDFEEEKTKRKEQEEEDEYDQFYQSSENSNEEELELSGEENEENEENELDEGDSDEGKVEIEDSFRRIHKFPKVKDEEEELSFGTHRRLQDSSSFPDRFNAQYLWSKGFSGKGVKVAVFDTGLGKNHPHFRNIVERTDWTNENTKDDLIGHGTFVSGVIASSRDCLGFAPDVELYSFRVFTADKVSYTSWFLEAFNYAIHVGINILNLSIGGPDFLDEPFVEKVLEMSSHNIIVVSAIGNDGPLYGTLNNPADQMDVIGVGGINFQDQVSVFSSRGMTTWELPNGYGRVKPDIVAYGEHVLGSTPDGSCNTLSGTSVASPVVAGAIALLASTLPESTRWKTLNPASMKQIMIEGASVLPQSNIFEQGFGKMDLIESYHLLREYTPHISFAPSSLDLTDCPYFFPYCTQPLYYSGAPIVVNVTILNGLSVTSRIIGEPKWITPNDKNFLDLSFSFPEVLYPYVGYLGIKMRVSENHPEVENWSGIVEGLVRLKIRSLPKEGETDFSDETVDLPIRLEIIPTPPRKKRILWDQFHNLRYPSGYFPRDALWIKRYKDPFDWNGDHIHTNFRGMFNSLRNEGYFVEVLGTPFTCFDADKYGTLLIVDPEEEFFPEEIEKLKKDVENGLSVAVFSDWYDERVMKKAKFYDENTKQWWNPVTGGSNVPALNDLLRDFGITLGGNVFDGEFRISKKIAHYASGTHIIKFPKKGILFSANLGDESLLQVTDREKSRRGKVPILGLYWNRSNSASDELEGERGRIAVFGDSSCMDDANRRVRRDCYWLLKDILSFTNSGVLSKSIEKHDRTLFLEDDFIEIQSEFSIEPQRPENNRLGLYSKVIGVTEPHCILDNFTHFNQSEDSVFIPLDWSKKKKKNRIDSDLDNHFIHKTFVRPPSFKSDNSNPSSLKHTSNVLTSFFFGCVVTMTLVFLFLRCGSYLQRTNNSQNQKTSFGMNSLI